MKKIVIAALLLTQAVWAAPRGDRAGSVKLGGHIGARIDRCIAGRVLTQDVDELVRPFTRRTETALWQSEFWGKWMLGACDSYRYNGDKALLAKIEYAADKLLATQSADGYIGNYAPEARLAQWDVWGQKYTLLGLQAYYDISHDRRALDAAVRLADCLMRLVGPGGVDIATLGNYRGMAAGSILEPVVFLYNATGKAKYLDFARWIVSRWESPEGPQLVSKALAGIPVAERFLPVPDAMHWTENGHKAYEMMSCYIGLLELYKVTGNPSYLKAVEMAAQKIIEQEITIAGSASATECFWHGALRQTTPAFLSNETCVTYTWMELCDRLYRVTGSPVYVDQVEKTMYNALQAALRHDGKRIASYVPLEGFRRIGERQCGMNINCCEANGPRGFALIPRLALTADDKQVSVNLYNPMTGTVPTPSGRQVTLHVETDYPASGLIDIEIGTKKAAAFPLALRIPLWSRKNRVTVNGEPVSGTILPGSYFTLERTWKEGDRVRLELELEGKLIFLSQSQAVVRGPVVYARDSRFADGFVDESIAIEHDAENRVAMTPITQDKPDFAWLAFRVNALTGIYSGDRESFRTVALCDFGSAGNTWDETTRYKVWLPRTIETADRHTWW